MTEIQKKRKRKGSKCQQIIQGENCPGKYAITYESNIPIFTCDKCGHQDITWKKFYEEYMQLFKTKDNWNDTKNHVSCLIGFFCHMYKEFYGIDYTFVPKSPNPYTSKECRDTWALLSAFEGNANEARKYVYWLFKKGINKSTNITNYGYINTPGLIRKYKIYASKKNVLNRASKLPEEFTEWCRTSIPEIYTKCALDTMNDLGALLSFVNHYAQTITDQMVEKQAISKAESLGLIKDGKLNIGETYEKSDR